MSNFNSIPLPSHPGFKDLTGQTFGRLTVLSYAGKARAGGKNRWFAACACGAVSEAASTHLISGRTRSCGCLNTELRSQRKATPRMGGTPEYMAWRDMWRRCTDQEHKSYHLYKDRTPPPEWLSFEVFFAELGPRPGPGFSLDRIENDKPYGPGNCRWATNNVQSRNRSDNVWVTTPDGRRVVLKDAIKLVGVVQSTYFWRRSKGQSIEESSNGLLQEAA